MTSDWTSSGLFPWLDKQIDSDGRGKAEMYQLLVEVEGGREGGRG